MEDDNIPKFENNAVDDGGLEGAKELLSKTTWKTEAEQIPIEDITDTHEQAVVIKCINQKTLTSEEMETLQAVLSRYRPAIQKYKPAESLENYDNNIEYVQNEKEFLRLLDEEDTLQTLTMYYPLSSGKEARLELTVKPVTNAQAVMEVSENMDIFADHTPEEIKAYADYTQGKAQTSEEVAIATKLQQEIMQKNAMTTMRDSAIEFLSLQTTFSGCDSSYEDMKTIYTKMHIGYLFLLFARVRDMTHLNDVDANQIFRESD